MPGVANGVPVLRACAASNLGIRDAAAVYIATCHVSSLLSFSSCALLHSNPNSPPSVSCPGPSTNLAMVSYLLIIIIQSSTIQTVQHSISTETKLSICPGHHSSISHVLQLCKMRRLWTMSRHMTKDIRDLLHLRSHMRSRVPHPDRQPQINTRKLVLSSLT